MASIPDPVEQGARVVRVGVLGCGDMGRELMRQSQKTGRARISAVFDPDPPVLERAAAEFQAAAESSADALCRRADVDAVLVASPPFAHLDNVLAAASAGKPVFCEKPLGLNVTQCDRMVAACRDAGVDLFVGQVLGLFPLFRKSLELIAAGVLGVPRAVSVTRAMCSGPYRKGWRTRRATTGGRILEVNVHEFDYMRRILGEPVEVYAKIQNILGHTDYEDQGFVMVEFAGGGVGCLHTSNASPAGEYRAHIQGTRGSMIHGGFKGTLEYQTLDGAREQFAQPDAQRENPYELELGLWLDSIATKTPSHFGGADARTAVAMAEAAYRSAMERRAVRLDEPPCGLVTGPFP